MSRKSSKSCLRGARTLACRVHTRVNAWSPLRICTRPRIVLHSSNQASLHRISLDIGGDSVPFRIVSHPMIVRFPLPKLLTSAMQNPIGLSRGDTFQRLQKQARRNRRQQKHMNVIRHNHEGPEAIVSQVLTTEERLDYQGGDRHLAEINGARGCSVEVAIHPRKSLAIGNLAGWREVRTRQTAMQMPRKEEPAIVGINVGKTALGWHALCSGMILQEFSRSHECERGTQECVRHETECVRHGRGGV